MYKKINNYIVIIALYTTTGFVCGMEEYEMKDLLKKGSISSVAINDYIVPVSTFSQALKKEASLTRTCLMSMKKMLFKQILLFGWDYRKMMWEKEKNVISMDDIRDGNERYAYLRNFYSKNIRISYYGDKVYMTIQPIVYFISPCKFTFEKLQAINFVIDNLNNVLQEKWNKIFRRQKSYTIEVLSEKNISSWIKIEKKLKKDNAALLKD